MRIAHVNCLYVPEHRGGATLQCHQLVLGHAARGHQVAVFAGALAPGSPMLQARTWEQDGLPVTRIVTTEGFRDDEERNWRHPAVEPAFAEFLERERPQIVHFHSIQSLGASLIPVAKRYGAHTVTTMHDLWWICQRQFAIDTAFKPCIPVITPGSCSCQCGVAESMRRREYLSQVLDDVDLILTPSVSVVERLRMSGVDREIIVDPNAVPRGGTAHRVQLRTSGPLRLLYMGGPARQKGVHILAKALRLLSEQGIRYEADVYGVDTLGYEVNLLFSATPARLQKPFDPDLIDSVMSEHDVLILPSVMFESSSRAVREALVRGMPVIATETGGPQEVIRDGVNGLLIPPDDVEALARAVRRLQEDRGLLQQLSQGGVLGSVPTPPEQAERLEKLYSALNGGRAARKRAVPNVRRTLFVAGIEGQPLHYRVHQKIEQLAVHGVESLLRSYTDPRITADLDRCDAVIVYRSPATTQLLRFIEEAHRRGRPVRFDVDDLIFDPELAESLPLIAHLPPDEHARWIEGTRRYRAVLLECGFGIASTPEIARQMEALGVPASVHRNGVDTALAVVSERTRRGGRRGPREEFVVGYSSGTDTHDVDLAFVTPALVDFMNAHPEVRVVLGGQLKPPPELLKLGDRVTRLPFISWDRHPDRLITFDLSLAPLTDTVFNESKSSIKWSEAALVEIPTLASATEPFRESVVDGQTGLLARDVAEWREKLEEAFTDRERLSRIGRAARFAAYAQGSPWLLGTNLLEIIGARPPDDRDRPRSDPENWPAEVIVTSLEPPGLLPGLRAPSEGTATAPGEPLQDHRLGFEVPGEGPLRRADVKVATWTQRPDQPVSLTLRRDGVELGRSEAQPDEIGDNGWVAFEFDPPVEIGAGARAELTSAPGVPVAPYVVMNGRRFVDGRPRAGGLWVRTFHQPPVPPDIPAGGETAGPSPNGHLPSRWRGLASFSGLVGRRAVSILRAEGPVRGGRRIFGSIGRRSRTWWASHR